jgi:hypothetical protein
MSGLSSSRFQQKQPWEADDCADVRAYYTRYRIPVAAALWCGVPPESVTQILGQCTEIGRGIYSHPSIPCIEPRCRALHEAIEAGVLEHGRDGKKVQAGEHVAPERRTVSRDALKAFMAKEFPASKPPFLFDEVERNTHSAITADAYRGLKASYDAKVQALTEANERVRKLDEEKSRLEADLASLRSMVDKGIAPGERAETTYLNIIGALLGLLVGESPDGKSYSRFASQAAVISALLGRYSGKPGIALRTLEVKFAEAKRSLASA